MIKTTKTYQQLLELLSPRTIVAEDVLRSGAGFEPEYAQEIRKTFSAVISASQLEYITKKCQEVYNKIYADFYAAEGFSPDQPIPFDYIRLDAYYDQQKRQLVFLEINGRGSGLHEISEELDVQAAKLLGQEAPLLLNQEIVQRHKIIQEFEAGPLEKVLYKTSAKKYLWRYFDAVQKLYKNIQIVTSWDDIKVQNQQLEFQGNLYNAIIRKAGKKPPAEIRKALKQKNISVAQQEIPVDIGLKEYLENLDLDCVAKTWILNQENIEQAKNNKDQLVLKRSRSSNARCVILGVGVSDKDWVDQLDQALADDMPWVLQDYFPPQAGDLVPHGQKMPTDAKILFGIFLMPNIANSKKVEIDFACKGYVGNSEEIMFDPAGKDSDIWFGNVIVSGTIKK